VEVPIQANAMLQEGDVLFRIDPEPFEDKIEGIEGELEAASKDLERTTELYAKEVAAERSVDQTRAKVEELEAELADARFDLEQTIIRAPSAGFVSQLNLRPGAMALPLRPLMTFVHRQERTFVGWFRQNSLLRLQKGDEAEVILDSLPGVILKGEVDFIVPVIGEGQMQPMADFLRYNQQTIPGRVAVAIEITDPRLDEYRLPGGLFGQAAIYTEHFHHIGVIRKVLLRMAAWMNYVFPLH
jgi:RND family efflux transporter MFP subunit